MPGLISEDFVGAGDFYFLDEADEQFALIGRAMLHSTNGRVFLATAAEGRVELYLGTIASSAGLSTVHYTTAATNGYMSVEGTVRNSNADGAAVRVWGADFGMYIYERGSVVATGLNGVAIQLSVDNPNTTAHITNDGAIISDARAIERNGAESVNITNNGTISVLSGITYKDTFGGTDFITNNGVMLGRIEFGGGHDVYVGGNGQLYGGAYGGDGNDTMTGGANDELLSGGTGRDVLRGGGGNDTILGGADSDFLYGGEGNDRLNSEGGGDRMEGGTGNDIYDVNTDDIIVELAGGGNDRAIVYNGGTFTLAAGVSIETLELWANAACKNLVGNELAQTILGNGFDNVLSGGAGADVISGGLGADRINGGLDGDSISGGGGSDTLSGNDGNDTIRGGTEGDAINGGAGSDSLSGDDGNDVIYGDDPGTANYSDAINGGAGADTILGFGGNDTLWGGADGDSIRGGEGNDVLRGEAGNDYLYGEGGADTFQYIQRGFNTDQIFDFQNGIDKMQMSKTIFANAGAAIAAATQMGGDVLINAGQGDQLILKNFLLANLTADDFSFF